MGVLASTGKLLRSRTEAVFSWPWATTVACLIAGKGVPPLNLTLMAIASVFFTAASVYIYNDYIDAEMDKINNVKSLRPLVQGEVSMKFAQVFVTVTAILGLGISFMINRLAFLMNLSYFTLFFIYSLPAIRIKKMFILKEASISSAFFLTSMVGSAAITNTFHPQCIYVAITLAVFSFFAQPALNDQFDIKEDLMYGVKTMAGTFTWDTKFKMLVASIIAPMLVTPLTYNILGFNLLLPIASTVMSILVLTSIFKLRKEYEETQARTTRKNFYTFFIALQIVFIISSTSFI